MPGKNGLLSIERIANELWGPVSKRIDEERDFLAAVFYGRPDMKDDVLRVFEDLLTVELSRRGIVVEMIDFSDPNCERDIDRIKYKITPPGAFFLMYNPDGRPELPMDKIYSVDLERCLAGQYV